MQITGFVEKLNIKKFPVDVEEIKQSLIQIKLENNKNNSHFLLFGLNPSRKRGISVALLFSTNLGSSLNKGFSRR
ncbi:hypothetical protein METP3_01270 [Methanosarcinales archaeon]|nr:hypothetical protein METP3_01270 [Methanosarcinales archaeon]